MSEALPPAQPPAPVPGRVKGRKRRVVKRWTRRAALLLVAAICGLFVTFLTVDIGNWFNMRERAEKAGTKYMNDRGLHIGKIHALMWPGWFSIEDVRIDGRSPGDRSFLFAKRINCHVQWMQLLQRRVVLEAEMIDWDMVLEQWSDGTTSMPKFGKAGGKKLPVEIRATSVIAKNGHLTYEDHGTPWSVVAPGMNIHIIWADMYKKYVGTATFSNGAVQILNYPPLRTDFAARMSIESGKPVQLENIDLVTEGSVSKVKGVVEFGDRWPEQRYDVDSRIDFQHMRENFFPNDVWQVEGEGLFKGQFHLFKGGRELKGDFTSATPVLTVRETEFPFPNLRGSLFWSRDRFDVTRADADFFGGKTTFSYGLLLNHPGQPGGAPAKFAADYDHVDVGPLSRLLHWKEIQVAGQARGHHAMTWTNGHFGETIGGDGEIVVTPPAGTELAGAVLPANLKVPVRVADQDDAETRRRLERLAIGGDAKYRLDPQGLDFDESWAATPTSYVAFHGRYAGGRLNMPVHLTSYDAQESDRLLAAILTERGSPTNAIPVGGAFTFDGKLTESFAALRAAGRFDGTSIYAFKNTWGRTTGDIVLHDNGVDITNGVVTGAAPGSRIDINGRFALGYRKDPTVEEMRATIHVEKWPVADFKQSFELVDWPIDGTGTSDLKLSGPYKRLVGDGTLRIDNGVAWKEPFDSAVGTLSFRGTGLAINPLRITKGPGVIRGDASINWTDSAYTFNVDGAGVRVDTLSNFSSEKAKLTGVLKFTAEGQGSFAAPSYTFKGSIPDLFVGDQGIGAVGGTLTVRNRIVTINQLEVAGLGQASGHGTIAFDDRYMSDLSLTITSASIDPYLKFFTDASWFQYTRLAAGGSVRIRGPLAEPASLDVVANIDDARLKLFDYELHNGAPFALNYQNKALWIGQPRCTNAGLPSCHLELVSADGTETQLQLSGSASGSESTIDLLAQGSASLAILRAFKGFGDVVASGTATLEARLAGDFADPHFSGRADIKDGRLKFPWLPRTLEGLNGPITINPTGVNFDGLHGQMGEGDVAFGGTIGFRDYRPEEFNLTLTGSGVTLRGYPKGFDSTVNASLWLRGPFESPLLGGDVDVTKVRLQTQIEPDVSLIAMAAGGGSGASADGGVPIDSTIVVRNEIHIHAAPMRLIDTRNLWITGSTSDLVIGGTIDKPVISGRIDVIAGKWFFSGNQFNIQPGSIEFSNPMKFDPYLNLQAEASTRGGGGQRYQVKVRITGSFDGKPRIDLSSEPWMSQNDILAVLLGATPNFKSTDLRNLRDPQQYEAQLMATLTAQFLVAQSGVSTIFEKTLPFDTVQFTPTMLAGGDVSLASLNPNARVTIGKRLSEKVYLIYSRDLNTASAAVNEVYLLQFDQNNRLQWILSRNEDRSFALDFRFRHIF